MVNKEFRPDVIWFNSFIITVLCVFAVILVRFEALNIFFAFGLFGVFLLVAVLSYMIGLQRGLLLSVGVTFCYGSYLIYAVIISKEMTTVEPLYVAWLFLIPTISILAAKLGESIASNSAVAKDIEAIEELVTLDGATGFYNNQGFFKKLDEEFYDTLDTEEPEHNLHSEAQEPISDNDKLLLELLKSMTPEMKEKLLKETLSNC